MNKKKASNDCHPSWPHEENLRLFLSFLLNRHKKQGGGTELRVGPLKNNYIGFFRPKDLDAVVELLRPVLDGDTRVGDHPRIREACITYNPHPVSRAVYKHNPGQFSLAEPCGKSDLIDYSMFVLRVDPVRPSRMSATDEEYEQARGVATALYNRLMKMGVASIPVACGSWAELLVPTIPYQDVMWAAAQGEKLAGLLAHEYATDDVKITTVAPGDSCLLPGTLQVGRKKTKDRPNRWVQLAQPDAIPEDLDLFSVMAEKLPAFSLAPTETQEVEPEGDEEDNNEEALADEDEDAGGDGEEQSANEEEPDGQVSDGEDTEGPQEETSTDGNEEAGDEADEGEGSADEEDTSAEQPVPTPDRRTLGPVTRWDATTTGQVLGGVLERAKIPFRKKQRKGETIYRLKECPVADGEEDKPYGCSLIVGTDGKIRAQCRHEDGASWRDFRPLIGWEDHIKAVLRKLGVPPRSIPYRADERGIYILGRRGKKVKRYQLTNFSVRIVRAIEKDDGVEIHHIYEVEACLGGQVSRFLLTPAQFASLNWVGDRLGPRAVVYPKVAKSEVCAAIQIISGEVPTDKVYEHLGWRTHGGEPVYLHAGGAISQHGVVEGVHVGLPEQLSRYRLPAPPAGAALRDAIRASLKVLEAAPDLVTIPLYAAVWRSPLGAADFGLHLVGKSGMGKTTLAVLIQQHFGAELDAQHTPATWLSTANANQLLAFTAKDALLLVDDFVPAAGGSHSTRKDQDADQLFRGQGNSAGRSRLRSDATLQPSKPPRSLPLSTGEETPRGQSVRARMLVIEMSQGGLDWQHVTACQKDAGEGHYAAALSGYICWLAPRLDEVRRSMPGRLAALREQATESGHHKRTPGIVANLAFGLELFSDFAIAVEALTPEQAEIFRQRSWKALGEAAAAQAAVQSHGDPAQRFLGLLREAISEGEAHLASPDVQPPADPAGCGWAQDGDVWTPMGDLVGWLDGGDVYLDPDASYDVAQRAGQEHHEPLGAGAKALHKRLQEQGHLASVDLARKRLTVRKTLGGQVRAVLHLRAESLLGQTMAPESVANQPQEK